jgi:hypothetical protein
MRRMPEHLQDEVHDKLPWQHHVVAYMCQAPWQYEAGFQINQHNLIHTVEIPIASWMTGVLIWGTLLLMRVSTWGRSTVH